MVDKKKVLIFIFGGIGIFGLLILLAGNRQGWFSPSESYQVAYENGEGIFVGTPVSMSGLKAGSVTKVDLDQDNRVIVEIKIQRKFGERLHEDCKATVGRPFIIGEKAITLTAGSRDKAFVHPGALIQGEVSLEITDMLSGGRLSPYFQTFTKLLDQLRIVIEGDGKADSINLVDLYKQAYTTLKAVDTLAKEVTTIRRDVLVTPETKKVIRDLSLAMEPLAKTLEPLAGVLNETQKTLPQMTKMAADITALMPQLSKTLAETTFTLQAMQRSFVLSGGVKELKKEIEENKGREPAGALDRK